MSASLVGSEMCIRDSILSSCCAMPAKRRAAPEGYNLRINRACRALSAPVSYTHLTLPTICSV
eukprot:10799514-Alexandrium_andersonii.AAC.1